ncbi:MAG: hypothetical protein WAV25_00460 [Minisyncoccia bacterium]
MTKIGNWLSLILAVLSVSACSSEPKPLTMYDEYTGQMEGRFNGKDVTFNVTIEETSRGQGVQRMIHLHVVDSNGVSGLSGITGHGYSYGSGVIYRVFLCGYPDTSFGCNAVSFDENGEVKWEPCDGDKDRLKPFAPVVVADAEEQLRVAMQKFRKSEFRKNRLADAPRIG